MIRERVLPTITTSGTVRPRSPLLRCDACGNLGHLKGDDGAICGNSRAARDAATVAWLRWHLDGAPRWARAVSADAALLGIGRASLARAARALGVLPVRSGRRSVWTLPLGALVPPPGRESFGDLVALRAEGRRRLYGAQRRRVG